MILNNLNYFTILSKIIILRKKLRGAGSEC